MLLLLIGHVDSFDDEFAQLVEAKSSEDSTVHTLKEKLQAALKEGVTTLETVQLLDSEKNSLLDQLRSLQDEFSQTVKV